MEETLVFTDKKNNKFYKKNMHPDAAAKCVNKNGQVGYGWTKEKALYNSKKHNNKS